MNEINKIEVLKTKCSTKQENRVLSDRTKGQITCVCVSCACYVMLPLEGPKLDISVTLHFQILHVAVVQL